MTFTTRLCAFAALAVAGFVAWQWNGMSDPARDVTALAVRQMNDAGAAAELREATWLQSLWPLVWPGLLILVGAVMFWDDLERLWKKDDA